MDYGEKIWNTCTQTICQNFDFWRQFFFARSQIFFSGLIFFLRSNFSFRCPVFFFHGPLLAPRSNFGLNSMHPCGAHIFFKSRKEFNFHQNKWVSDFKGASGKKIKKPSLTQLIIFQKYVHVFFFSAVGKKTQNFLKIPAVGRPYLFLEKKKHQTFDLSRTEWCW